MKNIVGIRFKKPGKIYFFDPDELEINKQDKVVVETAMGQELGEVVVSKRAVPEELNSTPQKGNSYCYSKRLKTSRRKQKERRRSF